MGVLGAGQRLAVDLACKHVGLIVGPASDALITEVTNFADGIVVVDHPLLINYHSETTLSALTELSKKINPQAVLFGNETHCQELVPRLAHRLNGSAAGDVLSLKVKSETETVLVTRSVYGGKAQATIELCRSPAIIWVRARAQEPAVQQTQKAEITRWPLALEPNTQIKLINRQTASQESARLEDARVIVSGGRGLAGQIHSLNCRHWPKLSEGKWPLRGLHAMPVGFQRNGKSAKPAKKSPRNFILQLRSPEPVNTSWGSPTQKRSRL